MTNAKEPGTFRDSRPVPDPTFLTTQQLIREIKTAREIIETRLDGMDKAIELLQAATDRYPALVTQTVGRLQELHEEKFRSIAVQFAERDTRTEQTSRDSKVAVDAALSAQVKSVDAQNISNSVAIAKSEAGFTKQIDQIGALIQAMGKATDDKIDDIKTRLNTIESRTNAFENRSTGKAEGTSTIGVIAMGIVASAATLVSIATLAFNILRH
jgi:hypothetical protein